MNIYEQLAKGVLTLEPISTQGYIQLLFDVLLAIKIIENVWNLDATLVPDKLELKRASMNVLQLFRAKIDPIDLAVYDGFLSVNVDRFYHKHAVILCVLSAFYHKPSDKYFFENLIL
jgi:hypothetical protein